MAVPGAPTPKTLDQITQTSIRYEFRGDTSGLPILEWQIGYSTDPATQYWTVWSTGLTVVGGLLPYTTYYFWSRGRNADGWGPWSPSVTARTIAGAWVKSGIIWKEAYPYIKVDGVWKMMETYIKSAGIWKKPIK